MANADNAHLTTSNSILCSVLCTLCAYAHRRLRTVGVKKKFPRSIRTTGARLKKTGGEQAMNGTARSGRVAACPHGPLSIHRSDTAADVRRSIAASCPMARSARSSQLPTEPGTSSLLQPSSGAWARDTLATEHGDEQLDASQLTRGRESRSPSPRG